ncbi:unnamed protein product [Diamesa serratosioi]
MRKFLLGNCKKLWCEQVDECLNLSFGENYVAGIVMVQNLCGCNQIGQFDNGLYYPSLHNFKHLFARDTNNSRPYFDKMDTKQITVINGATAFMTCSVRNLGNKVVSWIRHNDINLLAVGDSIYTADQRFQSYHDRNVDTFTLKINHAVKRDEGIYECQIGTSPPKGQRILLTIVDSNIKIVGEKEQYLAAGMAMNLTCVVDKLNDINRKLIWTHDNQELNADDYGETVSVITERNATSAVSFLIVKDVGRNNSGYYGCHNIESYATIYVHVLEGI